MQVQVRVTPIAEDGTRGEAIVHDDVTDYEHETNSGSLEISDTLVLQIDGEEVRYSLADHWVEITPDQPADTPDVVDETEQLDDLGNHPDDVRAQYARDQAAADRHADTSG